MSQMEELEAAAKRLEELNRAVDRLKAAEETLRLVNKCVEAGNVWRPALVVKPADRGYYTSTPEITVRVEIPADYVQQAAINAVVRCKRELNLLGYDWPKKDKK